MSNVPSVTSQESSNNGELVIQPRFTGRSYVAVLHVLVKGESIMVCKVDLAKDGAREIFVKKVAEHLPAVEQEEVGSKLLKLCDDRAAWLQKADEVAAEKRDEPTIADMLVQIAFDEAELCHDKDQNAYATIQINEHWETWAVRSKGFKLWLRRRLREEHDKAAHSDAVRTAIEEVEAKALFEDPETKVFVRLAEHDGAIWLDLADENWRAVRIASSGWEVIEDRPPVRFIRPRGMLPLAAPERGGSVNDMRKFLNVRDETDFVLLVAWLLACLRLHGPFPILSVSGEQGSAKSTLERLLRSLIDPNSAPLRSEPREPRDLVISAANSWIIGYDNLSKISPWLSDAVCRLSTGGGFATRELYTDREEVIFESQRPVMFNGITDLATRSDLLDRSLVITLAAIPDDRRKDEKTLWQSFDVAHPKILGALLDAVAAGLTNEHSVRLERLPRMADFALWATACESALGWTEGTFLDAYTANRASANDTAIEASLVGTLVQSLMASRDTWQGTSTELLAELDQVANENMRKRRDWPRSPRKVSGDLRRVAPNLRAAGIDVAFRKSGKRLIILGRTSGNPGAIYGEATTNHKDCNILAELPLHHVPDGLDGADGISQGSTDADIEAEMEERLAICTIDGGVNESEAHAIVRQQIGEIDATEVHGNDTHSERN